MDKKTKERLERFQQLFQWRAPVEIIAPGGDVVDTLYQRLVGDADLNKARTTALRYSRELRNKLKDTNSDDYLAWVADIEDYDKNNLIVLVLYNELGQIRETVEKEFIFAEPMEPDTNATTEELEEYQELDDTYEDRRAEALGHKMEDAMQARKAELEAFSEEDLKAVLIQTRINALCETELREKFIQMCVFLGTYLDDDYRTRAYLTFQQFLDSPDNLKEQLITGYNKLEISSVNLKGLLKATPSDQPSP
jgi:hypothetical protein